MSDIFLLLKSSDFIAHDLAHAYEDCSDAAVEGAEGVRVRPEVVELVLRRWFDLAPSMEFRCFVRENKLVGKCLVSCGCHLRNKVFFLLSGVRFRSNHTSGFVVMCFV